MMPLGRHSSALKNGLVTRLEGDRRHEIDESLTSGVDRGLDIIFSFETAPQF